MTVDTSKPTSRRAVLGAALGGAAAVGIHALASAPGVRAVDEPLLLNVGNAGTASTSLSASLTQDTVLGVSNSGSEGTAIQGASDDGTGLAGYTTTGNGVYADSMGVAGYGLHATGGGGAAVWAASGDASGALTHDSAPSTDETGVYGYCDVSETNSAGVWGDSNQSAGVVGTGSTGVIGAGGWGVWGYSGSSGGVGVYADSAGPSVTALVVNGKAHFSRSGKLSFSRTQATKSVGVTGVTSASSVIATIQANKSGLYVKGAVAGTNKITIYLSKAPGATVKVAWLILD